MDLIWVCLKKIFLMDFFLFNANFTINLLVAKQRDYEKQKTEEKDLWDCLLRILRINSSSLISQGFNISLHKEALF